MCRQDTDRLTRGSSLVKAQIQVILASPRNFGVILCLSENSHLIISHLHVVLKTRLASELRLAVYAPRLAGMHLIYCSDNLIPLSNTTSFAPLATSLALPQTPFPHPSSLPLPGSHMNPQEHSRFWCETCPNQCQLFGCFH